jgi:hypothetical protein
MGGAADIGGGTGAGGPDIGGAAGLTADSGFVGEST